MGDSPVKYCDPMTWKKTKPGALHRHTLPDTVDTDLILAPAGTSAFRTIRAEAVPDKTTRRHPDGEA